MGLVYEFRVYGFRVSGLRVSGLYLFKVLGLMGLGSRASGRGATNLRGQSLQALSPMLGYWDPSLGPSTRGRDLQQSYDSS